ncbi:hypothetical protein Hdeb2414_s0021g00579991 [Helianthus debilis subsp. tardiflorus]
MISKFFFSILFHKPVIQKIISNLLQTNYELAQLYVDFFACFFLRLFFRNYGTVRTGEPCGVEYLVGVQFLKDLDYLLPLCNEDTSPVTPCSDNFGV